MGSAFPNVRDKSVSQIRGRWDFCVGPPPVVGCRKGAGGFRYAWGGCDGERCH